MTARLRLRDHQTARDPDRADARADGPGRLARPVPARPSNGRPPAPRARPRPPTPAPSSAASVGSLKKRFDAPAWVVSALIHVGILGVLAAVATGSGEVVKRLANLDSTLVANPGSAEELTKIYADPAEVRSDQAVGDPDATMVGSGVGFASNSAPPPRPPRR